MAEDDDALRDAYWKFYLENVTQGRHHETQRSTVAATLVVVAGAIIGLATLDKGISGADLPLTGFLVIIGLFGAMFSAKQYERYEMHMERAREYRDALDALLPGKPIKMLKEKGDDRHNRKNPCLSRHRLRHYWLGLYLLLATIGALLSAIAIWTPMNIQPDRPLF